MLKKIEHRFVEGMPKVEEIKPGFLYISIRFGTSVHLCPCGCKNPIYASIAPARWTIIYDGERVSMTPSFGNWNLPCRSHYWIRWNRIIKARRYSDREIEEAQQEDLDDLIWFYGAAQ